MITSLSKKHPVLVSVIVTSFNRVHFLKETIETILKQTFSDFEVIIVDNMSTDATEEYVQSLTDPRVTFYSNPNAGIVAVNRNFGIQKAKGKYIAFCDDDDLWLLDKLRKQVELMEEKAALTQKHFRKIKSLSIKCVRER